METPVATVSITIRHEIPGHVELHHGRLIAASVILGIFEIGFEFGLATAGDAQGLHRGPTGVSTGVSTGVPRKPRNFRYLFGFLGYFQIFW